MGGASLSFPDTDQTGAIARTCCLCQVCNHMCLRGRTVSIMLC